jgi:fructose-1,6-bisphosphatase/inositol monophosphatase family enzyme
MKENFDDHLAFALKLSKRAGREMLKYFDPFGFPSKSKKDQSAVTTVDTLLNQLVIDAVHSAFPDHDILSEEGSSMGNDSEYVWVCDPLDGTRQFSMGTANFAFSIALTHKGRPVVGVIYEPYTGKLFQAVIGKGAQLNGKPIHVSKKNKLADSLCFFTSSIRSAYNILGFIPILIAHAKRVYNFACCTVESDLVASGLAEAVIYANDSAHDFAAVKVIVEEAGGKVTDLWGHEQRYDKPLRGVIVSNGHIHKQLISLLHSTLKKQYK